MTLTEIKTQILAMIEELNPESPLLTDDPDISAKINFVINQIQCELARIKKIPKNIELEVHENDFKTFKDIDTNFYQLSLIRGVKHEIIDDTVTFQEDGKAKVYYYIMPTLITNENQGEYEFELPLELLQILPYGVAGDLLKSDISANYGTIYANRYELMLQRIDPRYSVGTIYIGGDDYGI